MTPSAATSAARRRLVLIVDPDPHFRAGLRLSLEAAGFAVGEAVDAAEGERTVRRVRTDAVIAALTADGAGATVAERLAAAGHGLPVWLVDTAGRPVRDSVDFGALQVAGVFHRPVEVEAVIRALRARLRTA